MSLTLSIVIVNWNGQELIKKCIESIFSAASDKLNNNEYEIIVIDNGSTDDSIHYLNSLSNKIELISNKENIGYSSASNQGMKQAKGNYVLLLGSDTVVLANTLDNCVKFLDGRNNCGAVGCKLLNPDGTAQNNCKKFPSLPNGIFTYLSLDRFNKDYDMAEFGYNETIEVEQISTSFLMVRKDLLEMINYFNEKYKILYNDVDLCKKIWETGYKIYFYHEAKVIHWGSQSTKKAGFAVRKLMYRDIYRYYKNNFGIRAILLAPILMIRLIFVSAIK